MAFQIATATTKKAKFWKNEQVEWSWLLTKLATPVRTGETMAEYQAMKPSERDQRKDRGGFVGGYLREGRRKKDAVTHRSMVTLDADYCTAADDLPGKMARALAGIQAAAYTTHSHTAAKPRWRIIIPLAEAVPPEQYEPIARQLAKDIGIDYFDPTTYEASRLMYWPSCPDDCPYEMKQYEGGLLEPGAVLGRYTDWHDASAWPLGSREVLRHKRETKRLGDPREKKGIVGAFCRAFSISEAIARFLPEVYLPCEGEEVRYTYAAGTTAGGVVVYDDLFAFSHHATDPISGQEVNAFDLVRLNMFGEQDAEVEEDTPISKRPSYAAMNEFAGDLTEVKREINNELFSQQDDKLLELGEDWTDKLEMDPRTQQYVRSAHNFLLILGNDEGLKNAVGVDDFSHRLLLKRDLPWRSRAGDEVWRDSDDAQLRNYISRKYRKLAGKQLIDDAFEEITQRNRFHQVRDWLATLEWDGVPRAETLLIDFLGAEDTTYTRTLTKLFFRAELARIMKPGRKFDQCLVLAGEQGIGKSTVLARMGGRWFNDSITSLNGKDALEQIQGSTIIELAEMQAANKAENEQLKAFISRQVDKFRAPYGRRTEEYPRQCVFAATTNEDTFLKDRTGNRRFWIIAVPGGGTKELGELTREYVAQVWAELAEDYKEHKSLIPPREIEQEARRMQEKCAEGIELREMIFEFLETPLPADWAKRTLAERRDFYEGKYDEVGTVPRDRVCSMEIWCELLGGSPNQVQPFKMREINIFLRQAEGWGKPDTSKTGMLRFGKLYGRQRGFVRMLPAEGQSKDGQSEIDLSTLL